MKKYICVLTAVIMFVLASLPAAAAGGLELAVLDVGDGKAPSFVELAEEETTITTKSLPDAVFGEEYDFTIECTDKDAEIYEYYNPGRPNDFEKTGFKFSSSGRIYGMPKNVGKFTFTVCAAGEYGEDYATFTITIKEAHKHTLVKTEAVKSTCKDQGSSEYYTCSSCGKIFKDAEGKNETTVAAEKLPLSTEHTWGEWKTTKEATEEAEGEQKRVCTVCGREETRAIARLAHTHSFGDWTVTKQATCTEDGEMTRSCSCGEKEAASVPAAGHKWDKGVITTKPTKDTAGEKTYTCTVCGETKTETVEPSDEYGEEHPAMALSILPAILITAGSVILVCVLTAVIAVLVIKKKK